MFEPFTLPYVQEGMVEILLLSIPAGLVGTWIVLRGLSFYSHAIGTASFPGLVLADGLGFSPALGAFGMAGLFTALSVLASRSKRSATDSATALVLVGCLAAGVILASDVFGSGANIDTLLFGSLLAIGPADLILAAAAAVLAVTVARFCSHHWLAKGFDEGSAASLHSKSAWFDAALLATVALTVTAALSAVGALLVTAIMVIPAATVRMVTGRVTALQTGSILLAAAEGTSGLWLSVQTDAPPGATIAVVSGVVFAAVLALRTARRGRIAAIAVAAVGAALLLSACGGSGSDQADGRVTAVATTTQVGDLVREIGGDQVRVEQILQPNTDPHEYEPRPSDVQAFADADVVFQSGDDLDSWADQLIDDSGSDAKVVDLSTALPVRIEQDGTTDPHWWQNPMNVNVAAGGVEVALSQAKPAAARQFARNADRFRHQVSRIDQRVARCFDSVPPGQRKLVTDHDALAYFAKRYGIKVVGAVIPALTSEAQPSAGDLAELERTIEEQHVQAVFPESSYSAKLAEAVAADTGATTEYSLYGDALGPEGSGADTWAGMIKSNTEAMMRGFTGGKRGCHFD